MPTAGGAVGRYHGNRERGVSVGVAMCIYHSSWKCNHRDWASEKIDHLGPRQSDPCTETEELINHTPAPLGEKGLKQKMVEPFSDFPHLILDLFLSLLQEQITSINWEDGYENKKELERV